MAKSTGRVNCDIERIPQGLYIEGFPIVERWEKPIQEQLAYLTCQQPDRSVLEIGFGLGMAASAIHAIRPREHYIVEAHREIAKHAIDAFNGLEPLPVVIWGAWEEVLPHLCPRRFDAIIFDSYPLVDIPFDGSVEATHNYVKAFLPAAQSLLAPNGHLGFLDFSGLLSTFVPFSDLIKGKFSGAEFVPSPISPPPECSYATGSVAYIVVLEK
jgi:guanidinoacetate N-methyltransferase